MAPLPSRFGQVPKIEIFGRAPLITLEPLRSSSSYFWSLRGSRATAHFLGLSKRALINRGGFPVNDGGLASKECPLCELENLVILNKKIT